VLDRKIGATRCQILRLKFTNAIYYSAPPDLFARFKGSTSKERKGKRKGKGNRERESEGRERKGREGGTTLRISPVANSWLRHCLPCPPKYVAATIKYYVGGN